MHFIEDMEKCGEDDVTYFDPTCTEAYSKLHGGLDISLMLYYEYSQVNVMLKDNTNSYNMFLDQDVIRDLMNEYDDYKIFVTYNPGSFV